MPTAVALRDGSTAVIRPLEPGEQDVVREIWDGLSDRSKRLRFLSPVTELSPEDLDLFMLCDEPEEAVTFIEDMLSRAQPVDPRDEEQVQPHKADAE